MRICLHQHPASAARVRKVAEACDRHISAVQLHVDNACDLQRLIESMDNMTIDAFVYPGWGNPPRLIGDLSQAGNTPLGKPDCGFACAACVARVACVACVVCCMLHAPPAGPLAPQSSWGQFEICRAPQMMYIQ